MAACQHPQHICAPHTLAQSQVTPHAGAHVTIRNWKETSHLMSAFTIMLHMLEQHAGREVNHHTHTASHMSGVLVSTQPASPPLQATAKCSWRQRAHWSLASNHKQQQNTTAASVTQVMQHTKYSQAEKVGCLQPEEAHVPTGTANQIIHAASGTAHPLRQAHAGAHRVPQAAGRTPPHHCTDQTTLMHRGDGRWSM